MRQARLAADGATLDAGAECWRFEAVAKIRLNRSYYNTASAAYLAQRPLTVRGTLSDGAFIARTLWPEDFRLDGSAVLQPVAATPAAVRALVRAEPRGGAESPFAAFPIWERTPGAARRTEHAPILAMILNGAQSDDDEALAGHFALVTGRVGDAGAAPGTAAIGDWLVNNFYTLDCESEKGIIAAMLPLDNYLADLNSGQAWYRPSYLIAAVLNNARVASHIQSALARTYNQFYRHQLVYDHPTMNCASISVDVLRTLGWNVPARGATSWPVAVAGLPYFALRERSLARAAQTFDYLTEDRTRLFPGSRVRGDRRRPAAPGERVPAARAHGAGGDARRGRRGALVPTRAAAALLARVGRLSGGLRLGVSRPLSARSQPGEDHSGAAAAVPGAAARSRPAAAAATPRRCRARAVGAFLGGRHSVAAAARLAALAQLGRAGLAQ